MFDISKKLVLLSQVVLSTCVYAVDSPNTYQNNNTQQQAPASYPYYSPNDYMPSNQQIFPGDAEQDSVFKANQHKE